MTMLVEACGVTIGFGGFVAVADADLTLAPGATLGLVGESGSGKSSLAKALIGLVPIRAGSIQIAGHDLARFGRKMLAAEAQILLQDAMASLSPRLRVAELIAEPLRIHGRKPDIKAAPIEQLGLSALLDRYPHELSGGQAKRVALARALVLRPKLLIADEPTAGLDVSVQGELVNLLAALRAEHGLGLILVSHDLSVIRSAADRIAVMYLGRIVEAGPADRLFAAPAHPYTAALLAAAPAIDPERRRTLPRLAGEVPNPFAPPAGCAFHPRCSRAEARCRAERPLPASMAHGGVAACHFPLTGIEDPRH
jgi:oligopeptide/dipeptide ABC transporter ATP-binding protein